MRHPRAFTLLEIVGVVAVIGVAGALASFAMSDQVRQAKTKADAKAVVLRLQSEHRAARERLQPLKIHSTGRVVTFQRARGPHCATTDGPPTTAKFEYASLSIGGGSACFNGHGEPDNPPVSVAVGPPGANGTTSSTATAPAAAGMAVTAPLDDDAIYFLPIRLDRTGVHDDPAQTISKADAAALEEKLASNPTAVLKGARTGTGTVAVGGT